VNPTTKKNLNLFIFFVLAVVLLYFAFRGIDLTTLTQGFRNADYLWVLLSLVVGTAAHFIRALRWQLLIEPLGFKPSLWNITGALVTGYVANLVFPRLGEITRCGTLRKTDKIPFESLIGTVLVERAFDVLAILLLTLIVFVIRVEFFGKFLWEKALIPLGDKIQSALVVSPLLIVAGVLVIILVIVLIRRNFFGKKFHSKISSLFWGLIDGVKSVFTMKKRVAFMGYTLILWLLYWLMTWLLIFSTQTTSSLSAIDALFLMVVGSYGMAAPVQGGFGAYHVMVAMALGIYGITWEEGLIFAVISHESQTLLVLALGVGFMIYFFFRNRNVKFTQ
jgi:uncharacterized protein (TIRG00374 family)